MKRSSPLTMWAVIVRNPRTEWIHSLTLRRTRREARRAWLDQWGGHVPREQALKGIRFARVTITEKIEP